jgi:hypothetical protein
MHVHANQINPNAQLDALYAAEKAAAQREAARTRKKLLEFASVLAGELGEPCVVRLGSRDESQEQGQQQSEDRSNPGNGKIPNEGADASADHPISGWA